MPASARRWTADEVRAMQDESRAWPRYELIDGELLVTPAPGPIHQRAVRLLMLALHAYVEAQDLGEVTSPSTARWDRVTKRQFFGRRKVDDYWVVDLDARVVERSRPGDPRIEVHSTTLEWLPLGPTTPFVLDLPAFFARVLGDA